MIYVSSLRYWPMVGLVILWVSSLLGDPLISSIWFFGGTSTWLAAFLTVLVVPFTFFACAAPPFTKGPQKIQPLNRSAFIRRTLLALTLTFATVMLWPRPLISYKFSYVASEVRMSANNSRLDWLSEKSKATIPRGETELQKLPNEALDLRLIWLGDKIDAWGNPFMFVAEDRSEGLWIGIYSKGMDGLSASKGNDPDDQNSWGQDGSDYYWPKIARASWLTMLLEGCILALFYAPLCLLAFRRKVAVSSSREESTSHSIQKS